MKITRITKIRQHRIFRDFVWPDELPPFGQFNVIYGWNGSGKTTLSSLFQHMESRSAVTEGEAAFEFDGAAKVRASDLATVNIPHVRVFNRDFVAATSARGQGSATRGHRRPVSILKGATFH